MKRISLVLLIIIIFNFIFCNFAYAEPVLSNNTENSTSTGTALPFNASSLYQADQEGTVEIGGHTKEINYTQSVVGAILGIIVTPVLAVTESLFAILSVFAINVGYYHTDSDFGADKDGRLKVSSIIFGEFLLLDAGITKTTANLNSAIDSKSIAETYDAVKETSISMFEMVRYVALGLFIVLILVTAIRLSLVDTTPDKELNTAEERAKFKELILGWFIGFLFVAFVKYLILLLDIVLDSTMEALWTWRLTLESMNYRSFEFHIFDDIIQVILKSGGMQFFAYALLYIILSITVFKFFFKYIFRVFKVLFLVVVSPIVGVIYTLQKAGDNESNAIKQWLKSYLTTLLIQPLHAIMYLIFMFSASEIVINAPFLGIAFLWALGRVEKIIKAIWGIQEKIDIVGK